jgi:hypothetical protein
LHAIVDGIVPIVDEFATIVRHVLPTVAGIGKAIACSRAIGNSIAGAIAATQTRQSRGAITGYSSTDASSDPGANASADTCACIGQAWPCSRAIRHSPASDTWAITDSSATADIRTIPDSGAAAANVGTVAAGNATAARRNIWPVANTGSGWARITWSAHRRRRRPRHAATTAGSRNAAGRSAATKATTKAATSAAPTASSAAALGTDIKGQEDK